MRGLPSMTTVWAPAPPSAGDGQSGATDGWMRVMCSTTITGSPSTMPWTSKRNPPWVPASNVPMTFSTVSASSRRSRVSRISSTSTPSARAISRTCPPHTIVGTVGATIIGS